MIAFWILAAFLAASALGWGLLLMHWSIIGSLLFALAALVVLRGLASWVRRSLVLRERLPDEQTTDRRVLETNRYIFWRRFTMFGALVALYFVVMLFVFGLSPLRALEVLPGLIGQALLLVVQLGALFLANFALFFGPFVLFGRMGRQTLLPGDANYGVSMEDVRGQKTAVTEIRRILRLMEQGRTYRKAGGQPERGLLMVGPPGTGKTMLAKAIATSLHTPIIVSSGAAYQGMFIGMDMVAVWMCVRAAKQKAKRWGGCIIFIDEFDALGQSRGGMMGGGGMGGGMGGMFGGFRMGLNMLLVQMDGMDNPGGLKKAIRRLVNVTLDGLFIPRQIGNVSLRMPNLKAPRNNIFFIGATNRPSVLDEAVTRPGRFGRQIVFTMPRRDDRKDIADLYFGKKAHDPDLDTPARRDEFARVTQGYSPAEIEQALSMALMYAFEDGRSQFNWQDLREAMVNITVGLAQPRERTEREMLAVSRHEVGHAVAAHFYKPDHAHIRLTITERGDTGGHHLSLPEQEEFSTFRSQMAAEVRTRLAALACERVFYGENSTGVTNDLEMATRSAALMVGLVGMGGDAMPLELARKAVGFGENLISVAEMMGGAMEGGTLARAALSNPLGRRTAAQILGAAYIDDWRLMYVNREAIDRASERLMAVGEMVGDEIKEMLDSVGLRFPTDADPYPPDWPVVPISMAEELAHANGNGHHNGREAAEAVEPS
ncbi:MAG: AAA family ATPase [Candidatus Dormibacteraeota bacterium]|nr:AAA family ATPase [Candidatus Dormibacteraeota bacterium]MBO0743647.1 AAA family ATPase [Candidatus Dormibacteraeota bacterium]